MPPKSDSTAPTTKSAELMPVQLSYVEMQVRVQLVVH